MITHPIYQADTSLSPSTVAAYMNMTDAQLRALVTTAGGRGTNLTMRTVAFNMGRLFQKTREPKYSDKAALLLKRYAEVLPTWPMIARDGSIVPLSQVNWGAWDNGGHWGKWFYEDLAHSNELVMAFDYVASEFTASYKSVIEAGLKYIVEFNLRTSYLLNVTSPLPSGRGPNTYSNMIGWQLDAMIPFGKVVDPAFIHDVVRWMREDMRFMYGRDGFFHEGSPAYHEQNTNYLVRRLPPKLQGYSDPPGFTDPIDGSRYDNLNVKGDGYEADFDRAEKAMTWFTLPTRKMLAVHDSHSTHTSWYAPFVSSSSHCMFGLGHGILGSGAGNNQVQTHLHFSGTSGHEHYDCLDLTLWALNQELLSNGEYKDFGNTAWNLSTAAHNTVVVNDKNQRGRWDDRFTPGPDDAFDGLSYNPTAYAHGNNRNFGNLLLWDTTNPRVEVIEADGSNAYAETSIYRRLIAKVMIDDVNFYLIDIFRIKGGTTHDWMLHGNLSEDYGYSYIDSSTSEFRMTDGSRIRTTRLLHIGDDVTTLRKPAQRRVGEATYLRLRRTTGDTTFVAIHEPYKNRDPLVQSISANVYDGKAESPVGFNVRLANRTDWVVSTIDPTQTVTIGNGIPLVVTGQFAHVTFKGDDMDSAYLLNGSSLVNGPIDLTAARGDFSYHGTITIILRKSNGDAENAFVTQATLPSDDSLNGRTLILTLADGRTMGYTIDWIDSIDDTRVIAVNEEPGLEIRDGNLAKQTYHPWHGVRGPVTFTILGGVSRDAAGNVTSTAPIGTVTEPPIGVPVMETFYIYRDGQKIGVSTVKKFSDTTLQPGEVYTYSVIRVDDNGSESPMSNSQTGTTPPNHNTPIAPVLSDLVVVSSTQIDLEWT